MLDWLFGRQDTAESLAREVNSFFDGFRRLQTRIEALVLVNKEAEVKECELNNDTLDQVNTTLYETVERANTKHTQDVADEEQRHKKVVEELTAETKALSGSLRLATKVVNFAEE